MKTAGLSKRIRKEVIFEDISLSVPKGKVTAITGQLGVGRSITAATTRQRSSSTASVAEELLLKTRLTEEIKSHARNLLKELGLDKYRDAHPSTLSGGQKQRLAMPAPSFPAAGY